MAHTTEDVKKIKAVINRVLLVAEAIAGLTKTTADDEGCELVRYITNDTEVIERAAEWYANRRAHPNPVPAPGPSP